MNDEIRQLIREVCNEWVARGNPYAEAIHECFLDSTGDKNRYPFALDALAKLVLAESPGAQPAPSVPEGWLPIPEKHPTFDPVDLQLSDGSVLCGCVPQSDGDYWWEGPSGEVFIDPKYANVTHWRLAAAPKPGAQDTDATPGTQAQTSLSVPVGWKLVPIEPTPEMLASAWGIDSCDIERTYSTMLAAAPSQEKDNGGI